MGYIRGKWISIPSMKRAYIFWFRDGHNFQILPTADEKYFRFLYYICSVYNTVNGMHGAIMDFQWVSAQISGFNIGAPIEYAHCCGQLWV